MDDMDEQESARYKVDVDRLLQGQGWDNPEVDSVFWRSPSEDFDAEFDMQVSEIDCQCNLDELHKIAAALAAKLREQPSLIPKSVAQVESFAALGGYAHGPWSVLIDAQRSSPATEGGDGRLLIAGCGNVQHWLSVYIDPARNITIKGDQFAVNEHIEICVRSARSDVDKSSESSKDVEYSHLQDDIDDQDEDSYDERSYGHLEDEVDEIDDIETGEFFDWQESALPSTAIVEYRSAGLSLEDVIQLSRHIPLDHVVDWAQTFGNQSMTALELLKVGLGEVSHNPKLENVDLEELRDLAARVLRDGILVVLDQIKDRLPYESE